MGTCYGCGEPRGLFFRVLSALTSSLRTVGFDQTTRREGPRGAIDPAAVVTLPESDAGLSTSLPLSPFDEQALAQEDAAFTANLHQKAQQMRLRNAMGWIAVILLPASFAVSIWMFTVAPSTHVQFVAATTIALEVVALFVSVWKVIVAPMGTDEPLEATTKRDTG